MNRINENYNLPAFLIKPQYRIWRFLAVSMVILVITFNMVFLAYQESSHILGNNIYWIGFSLLVLYLFILWLNYSVLVPKLLLKNKYIPYFFILSAIILVLPVLTIAQEYGIRSSLGLPHRITSYINPLILIDNISSFVMFFICLFGIPVFVFLRQWIAKREELSCMEYENITAEINKLKGQIAPAFLSKTLNTAESLIKTNPAKTSSMLMKLGQLLRYQLYDYNRSKVVLNSEINFVTDYLELEQLNREEFQYQICTNGNMNNLFVSPMLFITVIQTMIEKSIWLEVSFQVENERLFFKCQSGNNIKLNENDFSALKKSLELQYPDNYSLLIQKDIVELQLNVSA